MSLQNSREISYQFKLIFDIGLPKEEHAPSRDEQPIGHKQQSNQQHQERLF